MSSYTGPTAATYAYSVNAFLANADPNACLATKGSTDVTSTGCARTAITVPTTNTETYQNASAATAVDSNGWYANTCAGYRSNVDVTTGLGNF